MKYFKIWLILSTYSTQSSLITRFGASIFLISKLLRFFIFLFFITVIGTKVSSIGSYSIWQMVLFFLTFSLIDTLAQFLFRQVYRFRAHIVEGLFDFVLLKPISPLFISLMGGTDILDLPILVITIGGIILASTHVHIYSLWDILLYVVLVLNGLLIATSFHIVVLGLGILTTSIDNAVMLYRDITQMGRVPIELYQEPLRSILTFAIPVGIMITFPAQALIGLLSPQFILISFGISGLFFIISLLFWRYSLKRYASASS